MYSTLKIQLFYFILFHYTAASGKGIFLAITQRHNSGTEGKIVTIFHNC